MRYNYSVFFRNVCLIGLLLICYVSRVVSQNTNDDNSRKISPQDYEVISFFVDNNEAVKTANEVINKALSVGKVVANLSAEDLLHPPILLLDEEINNVRYVLAVDDIRIRPGGIVMQAYAKIIGPKDSIYFGAPNLMFSGSGGIIGDMKLGLLSDYTFVVGKDKAHVTLKQINKNEGCFITFDCDGFKELALDANVKFNRNIMVPVDANGNPNKTGTVTTSFAMYIRDFNDWIVDISIPDFALTKYPKVAFSIRHAIIDFSDSTNDPDIMFPAGYLDDMDTPPATITQEIGLPMFGDENGGVAGNNSGNSNGSNNNSGNNSQPGGVNGEPNSENGPLGGQIAQPWRGFYIKQLKVVLPKEIMKRDDDTRIGFEARNLLIDRTGVSGAFAAINVLTLEEGRMQKWAFSVDKFELNVLKSSLVGMKILGRVELPVAKETQTLAYTGEFNKMKNRYALTVGLVDDLQFPAFSAVDVTFTAGSFVRIDIIDEEFYPSANLSGSLRLLKVDSSGKKDIEAPGLIFEELALSSFAPHINFRKLSLSASVHIKGTPVTIKELGFTKKDDLVGIYLSVDCNLDGDSSGIQASLGCSIYGKLVETNDKHKFKFDHLDLKDGALGGKFPGFEFYGSFRPFEGNAEFGTGFEAKLKLAVQMKPGKPEAGSGDSEGKKGFSFEIDAFGIFGGVNDYRYWAVDVNTDFTPCITLSALSVCGFSGGAYRRMAITETGADPSKLGVSMRGNQYKPKQNVGLGIRAGVRVQFSGTKSLSGSAMFQFQFSDHGSLQLVFFEGSVEFQVPMDKVPGLTKVVGAISKYANLGVDDVVKNLKGKNESDILNNCVNTAKATATIMLNFEEERFTSALVFTISLYNGLLVGSGKADILADFKKNEFHFNIGTYSDRVYLAAKLGNFKAEVNTYTMLGNDITGFPPLDPAIASFLKLPANKIELDARSHEQNIETGSGMLFGAGVKINYEDCKWVGVNVRAKVDFLAGFDAGFLKFDDSKRCNGEKFGIDNWYNMARFYLLLNMEVGRHKKCKKDYHHWGGINIGAFLEGQFPNPVYIEGKFTFRMCGFNLGYNFKSGERCNL